DVKGSWDISLSGSFIYWKAQEENLELGKANTSSTSNPSFLVNSDFEYKPGFKVGLGTNIFHDNWNLYLEWTRIHGSTNTHKNIDTSIVTLSYPTWVNVLSSSYTKFSGSWKNKYDMLDLELGRPYYLGTKLTVKPHFGARWGWIDQKFNVEYDRSVGPRTSHNKSDSWLLGPRTGFDSNWIFGHGFKFIGNAATSLFYQRLKTTHITSIDGFGGESLSKTYSMYNPYLEIAAGLGWGTYFHNNSYHFNIELLWEEHTLWNQNTMAQLNSYDYNPRYNGNIGNLTYGGFTITMQLDF
ncbi:MAG TPA: Lpg1974 family pore-forming outer membrane protein, partial [Chlamydiales bacterium]|nr:Lpg1974 family pore-forming outer membrane protein [Chlamydiales bacterium]